MDSDTLNIDYSISNKGFRIKVDTKSYPMHYPPQIWAAFPKKIRKMLAENFAFLSTFTLPAFLGKKKAHFDFNTPLLGSFFVKPILYYIPALADEFQKDSLSLIRNFLNTSYDFKSYSAKTYDYSPNVKNKSVNLFTFGKDSLLGFAVAEEIGLNPKLVYIEEPDTAYKNKKTGRIKKTYENKHKDILIKKFSEEFKKPVYKIKHALSLVREAPYFGVDEAEIPFGSQLTEYSLLSLPFNHYFKAKYLVYGNEASCSSSYFNKDGIMTNPAYDQSGEWVVEISKMLKLITKQIFAVSLVEPIHELAIVKILHTRYPHYAKYQMSCMAANNNARYNKNCHNCSKCARIYVFLKANKVDPKLVGFKENMFKKEKMPLYNLFSKRTENALPYDSSGIGRDEMLLAFYMAYNNGAKGYLIEQFKKKFLGEAKARKKELFKEFYGIHGSLTMPKKMLDKVLNIYKEELDKVKL